MSTKLIKPNYKVGEVGPHLKMALKRGAAGVKLLQTKGVGASGSIIKVRMPNEEKVTTRRRPLQNRNPQPSQRSPPPKRPAAKKPAAKNVGKKPAAKKAAAKELACVVAETV